MQRTCVCGVVQQCGRVVRRCAALTIPYISGSHYCCSCPLVLYSECEPPGGRNHPAETAPRTSPATPPRWTSTAAWQQTKTPIRQKYIEGKRLSLLNFWLSKNPVLVLVRKFSTKNAKYGAKPPFSENLQCVPVGKLQPCPLFNLCTTPLVLSTV